MRPTLYPISVLGRRRDVVLIYPGGPAALDVREVRQLRRDLLRWLKERRQSNGSEGTKCE